ncbi:lysine N(6)-hydroxylase/L-ornithine N(5)-oxygenase family protein [Erwinia pyrifoliae]|uniref:Lysine N(6)-hydroxylase/L-ornithine N(5)-oxygenase family protein n=1 Tax=Erwinia pyrifoliae TaxID=79967 RepID=A0ABY5X7D0_ERWPY|nr:lysine N(6)-hydroxylase/L-ornithine N(5)-oxygenase family protein [Erwinia pyrifoliae]AUX74432.1 alcaligin biosynthesis protein [Erwinia pyrifoliae]MCA8874851.1 alcaligin biosynthesis protein [Erwinia pyrifoliae]UWS28963.1 lysine N(6)-hydroxylase/L-ornithine N(5)-oxygenase family protein [Erwinia pyrifoliae]UWS33261.1 lysine N(6)-hydroxylase/L-ornithine N(5)-oxygenase family protein [Erwinia pyrifoliae]UXK11955.1 lysine N(6)-hydroxylase/L-ornithine N(5)-oxygenase family protein [Erwinia pyr
MNNNIYDFIGIGIGPFNLGLACLSEPVEGLNGIFLDQNPGFDWHTGMMLESAHLQTPFMADLVTMADPTSPYSLLNYMKQKGKLYSFYIREDFFLMRKEYNQYCQWAAARLGNLRWNTRVEYVSYDDSLQCYRVRSTDTVSGKQQEWLAHHLVLATGPSAWSPACSQPYRERFVHSSEYLLNKEKLQKKRSITVLGSGQSAAEIYYDLLTDIDRFGYQLNWITRAPRFYPLEYTKLTLEMTSPEWIDYFHSLPAAKRDELNASQKNLYKGINSSLINDIYDLMYVKQLDGKLDVNLFTHSELTDMRWLAEGEFELKLHQQEQDRAFSRRTEGLVMATGYQYRPPAFIEGIQQRIQWDEKGRYDVQRNYSIDRHNQVFVQNAELHTHGFVTPDLGMACYRNSVLLRDITGREVYPVERQIAFQTFPAQSEI